MLQKDNADLIGIEEKIRQVQKETTEKAVNSAAIYKQILKCDLKKDVSKEVTNY